MPSNKNSKKGMKVFLILWLLLFPPLLSNGSVKADKQYYVGVFYYPWYGFNSTNLTWNGVNGTSHWNDSGYGISKDMPLIGFYSSYDNNTLKWQFDKMREIGINFIVISWWGWGITNFSNPLQINRLYHAIDNATKNIFKFVEGNGLPFKVALMVEPFSSNMNYSQVFDYVYENYYSKYDCFIYKLDNKPLLLFFNPLDPPADGRFNVKVVGHQSNVDIFFWKGMDALEDYKNVDVSNYMGDPVISEGIVSIIPRYDDSYLYQAGSRNGYMIFDKNFSKRLYQKEWDYVLQNKDKIHTILIYSWNEYHERSAIEPHFDLSGVNTFYLVDSTKYYVTLLKDYCFPYPNIDKAIDYLVNNYNPSFGLIPEVEGGNIYWVYSDNYLAYLVLKYYNPNNGTLTDVADNISRTLSYYTQLYNFEPKNKFNILGGSTPTFGNALTFNLTENLKIDLNNGTTELPASDYGDIAFLKALYYWKIGEYKKANDYFVAGARMFDGVGINDLPFREGNTKGIYQTYKLGLYVLAGKVLGKTVPDAVVERIKSLQASNGGFLTGYYPNGTIPEGVVTNTETTAIIVYAFSPQIISHFFKPQTQTIISYPSPTTSFSSIYYIIPLLIVIIILISATKRK
ncbi:MAG: hypothetical protein QXK55_06860 [Nitrososphaeria archaeon]